MKIKAVIFDWGGVISPKGAPDEVPKKFSTVISHKEALPVLLKGLEGLKRGEINEDQFWQKIEKDFSKDIPPAKRNIWTDINDFAPNKKISAFVEDLKDQGLVVGVLSNTFPLTAEAIRSNGWYEGYSPVILSSDVQLAKPDREIYKLLLERLKLNASQVIFIDDQEKCLAPAKNMGFHTVKAVNPRQIIKDIKTILE